MEKDKTLSLAVCFLGIAILIGSFQISDALVKMANNQRINAEAINKYTQTLTHQLGENDTITQELGKNQQVNNQQLTEFMSITSKSLETLGTSMDKLAQKNNLTENINDFMSFQETAKYLGVSTKTLETLMEKNNEFTIPFVEIDNRKIFSKKALENWLAKMSTENKQFKIN